MPARVRNPKPLTVGPYGETYTDRAGRARARLTDEGRRVCGEWMVRHPHPVALVKSAWPRLYGAARELGLSDDDIDSAAMEGVSQAFIRFDPSRGTAASTAVTWGVRGAVADLLRHRLRHESEMTVSQFDNGEARYVRAAAPDRQGEDVARADAADRVREAVALAGLAPRERQAFELCLSLTQAEASGVMGSSKQNVNQLRSSAVRKIRSALGVGQRPQRRKRPTVAVLTDGHRRRVLRALERFGPLTAGDVGKKTNLSAGTTAMLLAELVAGGSLTVTREPRKYARGGVAVVYRLGQMTEGRRATA